MSSQVKRWVGDVSAKRPTVKRVNDYERQQLFDTFWNLRSWEERKTAVIRDTDGIGKNQHSVRVKNRWFVKIPGGGRRVHVCRQFYATTIGMSPSTLGNWINKERKPKHGPRMSKAPKTGTRRPIEERDQNYLVRFLDSLAAVPSHYCRNSPTYQDTKFLDANTRLSKVYRKYKRRAERQGYRAVSMTLFRETLKVKKIRVFRPRKDFCDKCKQYEKGNLSQDEYNAHRAIVALAYGEKKRDEEHASEKHAIITMDLQAIQLAPKSNASQMYFKTKLGVHNYSFYNKHTKEAKCFFWNETDGTLEGNVFTSVQQRYFRQFLFENPCLRRITIWSDGCNNQTRNRMVGCGFLDLARRTNTTIVQKYLAVGHTMMEVDSMHSGMERETRHAEIHLPTDYERYAHEARKEPFPYRTDTLTYKDFTHCPIRYITSIRPGKVVGDKTVYDLKAIKYLPAGTIFYKCSFDEPWKKLPHPITIPDGGVKDWEPMFTDPLPISRQKYSDLQDLKSVIPHHAHAFYDALPHQ